MRQLRAVPVVDVHKENFKEFWPALLLGIRSSTFVAIDTELSGLGNRKRLIAKDVDERYKALSEVAKSHSIISLGFSCFKFIPHQESPNSEENTMEADPTEEELQSQCLPWSHLLKELSYSKSNLAFQVQTYNITLLCSESYVVEPESLSFLVDHGFDFNKQYALGVPYHKGTDKQDESAEQLSVRGLLNEIIMSKVPVVFHNGFVDLIFLYHNLYASIPSSLNTFLGNLTEIFQNGIFDTKYISEFNMRWSASYLEYIFTKSLWNHRNDSKQNHRCIQIEFLNYPDNVNYIDYKDCIKQHEGTSERKIICQVFAAHGWCSGGLRCVNSHDVNLVLNEEWVKKNKKKRKGDKKSIAIEKHLKLDPVINEESIEQDDAKESCDLKNFEGLLTTKIEENSNHLAAINLKDNLETQPSIQGSMGHRAGFDAFMTGFTMAMFILKHEKQLDKLLDSKNKICLSAKQHPLNIVKSQYAKTSADHTEKMSRLFSNKI